MKYYITRGTLFKIEGDDIYQLGEDMDMALPQGDGWSKRNIAWIKIVTDSNPKEVSKEEAEDIIVEAMPTSDDRLLGELCKGAE